jgi:hypothetical protein
MSPLPVQKLHTTIALVFNTERYDGKLIQRDDSTIMLKDYRCMSVQLLHLIQEQFPQVDITVQEHEDRASVFVMLLVMRDNPSVLRSSTFAQTVIFSVMLTVTLTYELIYMAVLLVWI